MEKNIPFGPNVKLPSIEGLTSTCEEELYVLMKEIDLAFERKNKELLSEVERLRVSRDAKHAECKELKSVLKSRQQFNKKDIEERIKQLLQETEKLKHENASLKNTLQNNSRIINEQDNQLESLRNNLIVQKEENFFLKEQITKLNQEQSLLQKHYQSLLNLLSCENKMEGRDARKQNERTSSDFMDAFISQEKEKYLEEENEHCNELMSKINSEIEHLRILISTETK